LDEWWREETVDVADDRQRWWTLWKPENSVIVVIVGEHGFEMMRGAIIKQRMSK